MEKEMEIEGDPTKKKKNNYLLQRFDICRTLPPSEKCATLASNETQRRSGSI